MTDSATTIPVEDASPGRNGPPCSADSTRGNGRSHHFYAKGNSLNAGFVIGLDIGQTTVKAVIFDDQMSLRGVGRVSSPMETKRPRHVERSQEDLWQAASGAIREALRDAHADPSQIRAVSVAGHGDGLHLVDAAGRPVSAAVTAMDTRAFAERDELLADEARRETVLRITGQAPAAGAPGLLLKWFLRNDPAAVEQAAWVLSCKDVVRHRLTGEIATDYSDASASFLDVATATWSDEAMAAYGLEGLESLNPPLQGAGELAGTITRDAAEATGLREGTPVMTGVHDVQAASIGMGALIEDHLALVAGSFATNGVTTRRPDTDPRWQSRLSLTPDIRIAMSTSPTASPSLNWLLSVLGVETSEQRDRLFAEAAELDADTQTPLVLPYLLSSPLGPDASAALLGVRHWHSRAHLVKGVLEGIALIHYWHTSVLATRFTWKTPIALSGGISKSPLYASMVAGSMDAPIEVIENEEAGAWGAAALGWVHAGRFSDIEEAQQLVPSSGIVEPDANSRQYWSELRQAFDEANDGLGPWWEARAGHGS